MYRPNKTSPVDFWNNKNKLCEENFDYKVKRGIYLSM